MLSQVERLSIVVERLSKFCKEAGLNDFEWTAKSAISVPLSSFIMLQQGMSMWFIFLSSLSSVNYTVTSAGMLASRKRQPPTELDLSDDDQFFFSFFFGL